MNKNIDVDKLFAVVYQDDGPNGICGQSCSTTNPWNKLYLFESVEEMMDFVRKVGANKARRNVRITNIFYPKELSTNDINFISG